MAAAGTAGAPAEREGGLRRGISGRMLAFFVLGDILGAGIYIRVGSVADDVGGAIWAAFLLALVLAALTAMSYAELVTKYPGAGGAPLYANKAFNNQFFTFMLAFAVLASGIASACAAARSFGGTYMDQLLGSSANAGRTLLVAALFIVGLALVNFWGVSESVKVNIGLTLVELSGLIIVMIIGAAAIFGGAETVDPSRAVTFKEGSLAFLVLAGAATAFYALIGFEDAVNMAEETQNPTRTFPRALLGGLFLAGIIYLVVSTIATIVVPTQELADASGTGPLLSVVTRGPLAIAPGLFSAIALIAITNTALLNLIMASRVLYGMSNQGVIPAALGRTHRSRRTPYIAIIFSTVIALALVTWGTVGVLADTTSALLLGVFSIVNVAVLVLRRDRLDRPHFRTPSVLAVLGAGASLLLLGWLLWGQYGDAVADNDYTFFLILGGLLAIGLVLWFVNVSVGGRREVSPALDPSQLGS